MKKFKFDISKYNFKELAEFINFAETIWKKQLKLETKCNVETWDLNYLYFQGVDFSKSDENKICVKFIIHDWNSPYETDIDIPIEAFVDWNTYETKFIENNK